MNNSFENRKGWRETAVVVYGELKPIPPANLLNELFPRHPRLSGWPIWIDSRGLGEENQPYPIRDGWEALVVLNAPQFVAIPMIDFWRLQSKGRFYHRRTYEDDVWARLSPSVRGKVIDFPTVIQRVAEAVATASVFARQLSAHPDESSILMAVRWSNLHGRLLASWSEPTRELFGRKEAYEDSAASEIVVAVSAARDSLAPHVEALVQPLFTVFGVTLSSAVIQDIALKVLRAGPM